MRSKLLIFWSCFSMSLVACSTINKPTIWGGVIGGVSGALIGQIESGSTNGLILGSLIGLGAGSFLGNLRNYNKPPNRQPPIILQDRPTADPPLLTQPKVRSYIVPDAIEGNRYIKSHRVYILEDPGSWSKNLESETK